MDPPWTEPALTLLGPARGETLPGGGRALIIASAPVHTVAEARALGGRFVLQLRDADPHGGGPATVESPVLEVELDLGRYEFE